MVFLPGGNFHGNFRKFPGRKKCNNPVLNRAPRRHRPCISFFISSLSVLVDMTSGILTVTPFHSFGLLWNVICKCRGWVVLSWPWVERVRGRSGLVTLTFLRGVSGMLSSVTGVIVLVTRVKYGVSETMADCNRKWSTRNLLFCTIPPRRQDNVLLCIIYNTSNWNGIRPT